LGFISSVLLNIIGLGNKEYNSGRIDGKMLLFEEYRGGKRLEGANENFHSN
jgi:hypothetical protein